MNANTSTRCAVAEFVTVALALGLVCFIPTISRAQSCPNYPGDKVVWGATTYTYAHDYIDASTLIPTGSTDVCAAINQALVDLQGKSNICASPLYNNKGLVDARGISPPSGRAFACSVNPFPSSGGHSVSVSVLLPAGQIPITGTWVLGPNMRLVGQGPGVIGSSDVAGGTTLSPGSAFTGPALISMGDEPSQPVTICGDNNCNGISIEHLRLDGSSVNVIGITNNWSQELNYVNDVQMTNMVGTGLQIVGELSNPTSPPGKADNSGPYTNIYYSGSGSCVSISATYGTRGIHGSSCNGSNSPSVAAILLDGSNNTIQDVTISGYIGDGIAIGSGTGFAQDNLLFNIAASSVANVVHVYKTNVVPTDLTLMGISGGTTTIIQDDLTGSSIPSSTGSVGLYVLGEAMSGTNGYSRFTTSSSSPGSTVPAWYVGPGFSSSTGNVCQQPGSLYSATGLDTSISTVNTLWGCVGSGGSSNWFALSSN
jgi:hypothetical protein